ncbi:hypothetical protein V6N13_123729 [Hibiscus sabdariffa]|uniref:DUF4220 domain-containing protein n=1 Tax=Hibiscus sabdariffa TaxID=183260 RepID=A0ABR2QUA9_9ROSI
MNPIAVIGQLWSVWSVRAFILLSLILQIILFVLGNKRKYTYKSWKGFPLWLAYVFADTMASAIIGKLCITCLHESAPSNFLRGFWASCLLLHLGGPDTMTAYAFEGDLLWVRHFLGVVFQAPLVVYVFVFSWTGSWLSFLNIPLFLAGVAKYFERTWCFYSATSKDFRREVPFFEGRLLLDNDAVLDNVTVVAKTVLAHRWFALKRPDMRNHFSSTGSRISFGARVVTHLQDTVHLAHNRPVDYFNSLVRNTPRDCLFDIAAIELEFMFDMLYTKSAIIYTKMGFILHSISFCCTLFVLPLFVISFGIGKWTEEYSSGIDICITGILLVGAVALEIWGLFLLLSSDWFVVMSNRDKSSRLLGRIFQWSLREQQQKKRWSGHMGQFNLLSYCKSIRNENEWWIKILQKFEYDEVVLKNQHTSFEPIPASLKGPESFPQLGDRQDHNFTRGEKALEKHKCADGTMIGSLSMDLGATIMIWHIATEICYPNPTSNYAGNVRTCKIISDYMMYLLAVKPSMISDDGNFWFVSVSKLLREELQQNEDIPQGCNYEELVHSLSLPERNIVPPQYEFVLSPAIHIADVLRQRQDRVDVLMSVWLEMMHYTALCCPSLSHRQELSQGCEILTMYWLLASYQIYFNYVGPE